MMRMKLMMKIVVHAAYRDRYERIGENVFTSGDTMMCCLGGSCVYRASQDDTLVAQMAFL